MTKPMLKLSLVLPLLLASTSISWQTTDGFILQNRWSNTATVPGGGLVYGDPTELTWSLVDDGTTMPNLGPSDLIANLDATFGAGPGGTDYTLRPWFSHFETSFDRFSQLSGLSYTYEPNDDGATHRTLPGIDSVRGDVRIGGASIDGPSNTLAFNQLPDNGDMTIDTDDMGFFSNSSNDFRAFRNVIMHEHGHGIGILHSDSDDARLLMEPFIQTTFSGPQMDDLRAIHRGYGDFYEKSNGGVGNDVVGNATDLGIIASGSNAVIGSNAVGNNRVIETQIDFVSIDDNSDLDFFAFTVSSAATVDLTVTPVGAEIMLGPQGGAQVPVDAARASDLAIELIDSNQMTTLATDNSGGLGEADMISFDVPAAGEYYARINGLANNVQMYELMVSVTSDMLLGDFDNNGFYETADVDELVAQIAGGSTDLTYDLNTDDLVNTADLAEWLAIAGNADLGSPYLGADANLDGTVGGDDFEAWNGAKFSATAAFSAGDFTADGFVDGRDFFVWNALKGQSSLLAVPEPQSAMLLLSLAAFCWRAGKRRS